MPASRLAEAVTRFIRERMILRPLPFRPDISIYTPTPQSGIHAWLAENGWDEAPPYWAYAWGGGATLVLYLQDHPETVAGKRVLDFGAGSGLVAIAAHRAGAAEIIALEPNALGQIALHLNAEANGTALTIWHAPAMPDVDVVLAGDVFYDAATLAQTLPILTRLAQNGATILVGDPFRRDLPLKQLELIARYDVPDMGSARPVASGVFALRP